MFTKYAAKTEGVISWIILRFFFLSMIFGKTKRQSVLPKIVQGKTPCPFYSKHSVSAKAVTNWSKFIKITHVHANTT